MGDLSSQSGDHGVNVNPASASRIEVVRGPATLLYGANAIGGLVNVITNDIPKAPVTTPTGSFTLDGGSRRQRRRRAPATSRSATGTSRCMSAAAAAGPAIFDRPTATFRTRSTAPAFAEVGLAYTTDERLLRRQLRVRPHALRHSLRRGRRPRISIRAADVHAPRREAEHGRASSTGSADRSASAGTVTTSWTATRSPPLSRTTPRSWSCSAITRPSVA